MPKTVPPSGAAEPGLPGYARIAVLLVAPGTLVVCVIASLRSAWGAMPSDVLPMALGAGLALGLLLVAAVIGARTARPAARHARPAAVGAPAPGVPPVPVPRA